MTETAPITSLFRQWQDTHEKAFERNEDAEAARLLQQDLCRLIMAQPARSPREWMMKITVFSEYGAVPLYEDDSDGLWAECRELLPPAMA